jgi:hypothetical protein
MTDVTAHIALTVTIVVESSQEALPMARCSLRSMILTNSTH